VSRLPSKRLVFRTRASTDLRGIARATKARWGDDQAARYVAAIRASITSLTSFDRRFPETDVGHRGLRKLNSGHHMIFYLPTDDSIEIVRILHERMDAGAVLGERVAAD
jgi:toxin ParE1/3/4